MARPFQSESRTDRAAGSQSCETFVHSAVGELTGWGGPSRRVRARSVSDARPGRRHVARTSRPRKLVIGCSDAVEIDAHRLGSRPTQTGTRGQPRCAQTKKKKKKKKTAGAFRRCCDADVVPVTRGRSFDRSTSPLVGQDRFAPTGFGELDGPAEGWRRARRHRGEKARRDGAGALAQYWSVATRK